jgi:hypothetical protein
MSEHPEAIKEQLIGTWRMESTTPDMGVSYAFHSDGRAEQIVHFDDGETLRQPGTWTFDGVRHWKVALSGKRRSMQEEIDFDVVKIGATEMECTDADDDAIIIRFSRIA